MRANPSIAQASVEMPHLGVIVVHILIPALSIVRSIGCVELHPFINLIKAI